MMPVLKSTQITSHARQPRPLGVAGRSVKVASAAAGSQSFGQTGQPGKTLKPDDVASREGNGGTSARQGSQRPDNDALPVPFLPADISAHASAIDSGAAVSETDADPSVSITENSLMDARRAGYEEGREQGWDAGYEQGVEEGLRMEREEVTALQTRNERMVAITEAISLMSQRWQAEVESAAIEIGYAALLRILGQKSADRAMVEGMVRAVLEQLPERRLLNIHLAPADHALLHDEQAVPPNLGAALLADERVSMGGCIVDTDAGSLDGRLETRLAELKAVLVEVYHAREMPQ